MRIVSLLILIAFAFNVTACGYKGNLKSPAQMKSQAEKKAHKQEKEEKEQKKKDPAAPVAAPAQGQ